MTQSKSVHSITGNKGDRENSTSIKDKVSIFVFDSNVHLLKDQLVTSTQPVVPCQHTISHHHQEGAIHHAASEWKPSKKILSASRRAHVSHLISLQTAAAHPGGET